MGIRIHFQPNNSEKRRLLSILPEEEISFFDNLVIIQYMWLQSFSPGEENMLNKVKLCEKLGTLFHEGLDGIQKQMIPSFHINKVRGA